MSSRIEQIIEEIEEYVDSCKYQPLSTIWTEISIQAAFHFSIRESLIL